MLTKKALELIALLASKMFLKSIFSSMTEYDKPSLQDEFVSSEIVKMWKVNLYRGWYSGMTHSPHAHKPVKAFDPLTLPFRAIVNRVSRPVVDEPTGRSHGFSGWYSRVQLYDTLG